MRTKDRINKELSKKYGDSPLSQLYLIWANFSPSPPILEITARILGTNTQDEGAICINRLEADSSCDWIYFDFGKLSADERRRDKERRLVPSRFLHFRENFGEIKDYLELQRTEIRKILEGLLGNKSEESIFKTTTANFEIVYDLIVKQSLIPTHFEEFKDSGFSDRLTKCSYCQKFFYLKRLRKPNQNHFCTNFCKTKWLSSSARRRIDPRVDDISFYLDLHQ